MSYDIFMDFKSNPPFNSQNGHSKSFNISNTEYIGCYLQLPFSKQIFCIWNCILLVSVPRSLIYAIFICFEWTTFRHLNYPGQFIDIEYAPSGLVTPYGNVDLGHHWLRLWLVDWRCQYKYCHRVKLCMIYIIRSSRFITHRTYMTNVIMTNSHLKKSVVTTVWNSLMIHGYFMGFASIQSFNT